jgi:putative Ca2+/H+ antiporter (TMEM165/GDT1 family)
MSKSLFWATFATVFLAELGDKTQLAAMLASARSGRTWVVFASASLALVAATLVGVLAGGAVFRYVPQQTVKYIAGAAFICVGAWVMLR